MSKIQKVKATSFPVEIGKDGVIWTERGRMDTIGVTFEFEDES